MSSTFILVIFIFSYVTSRKYFSVKEVETPVGEVEQTEVIEEEPKAKEETPQKEDVEEEREAVIDEI